MTDITIELGRVPRLIWRMRQIADGLARQRVPGVDDEALVDAVIRRLREQADQFETDAQAL